MSSPVVIRAAPLRLRLRTLAATIRRGDRKLFAAVIAILVLESVAAGGQAFTLKVMLDAAVSGRWRDALAAAAGGAAAAGVLGALSRVSADLQAVLTDRVGMAVNRSVIEMTAGIPGIEHLERPDYLDQLAIVRTGGAALVRSVFSVLEAVTLVVRMAIAVWLLMTVNPVLALLPLFGLPSVALVGLAARPIEQAATAVAERRRSATQLHRLFLQPAAAMELRVFGASAAIDERADRLWQEVARLNLRAAMRSLAISTIGTVTITVGYVGALAVVVALAARGGATPGDILLVSRLALQLRGNVAQSTTAARQTVSALRSVDRYLWLQWVADEQHALHAGARRAPDRIEDAIVFEDVTFCYPRTDRPVLSGVDLRLRRGTTVAVVGANGAGKTTLVKLLCGMYVPTAGRITVDGVDLREIAVDDWRARLSGSFQDYLRLEAPVRDSVGASELSSRHDDAKVSAALERGDAAAFVSRFPDGLDAHVGRQFAEGVELSGGQWQRLAVARAMMRATPVCLLLDEPTAALDPAAEHQLYRRYAGAAAAVREHGITVLVSHRFSSVRMADHIVVLGDGRILEHGTHDELIAAGGTYAAMYRRAADAYG